MNTKKLATLGIFSAIAIVLLYMVPPFPILPGVGYLKYDLADIPILLCTLAAGPIAGLITTIAVSVIQGITISSDGGIIGIIMHILATGSLVLVLGFFTMRSKSIPKVIIGLILGALAMTAMMLLFNYIFTPIYLNIPRAEVAKMLLPIILPFNLLKAGINAAVSFIIFIPLRKIFEKVMK